MEKTNKAARISPTLTPDLIKRGGKEVSLFAAFLICLRAKFPLFLSLVLLFFYFLISRILIGVMLFLRFREFLLVQLGFDFTYSTFARLHFVFGIYFFRRLLMQIASSTVFRLFQKRKLCPTSQISSRVASYNYYFIHYGLSGNN